MTPFKLTLRDVVTAALKARAENRLGAQTGKTECMYRYPDGCVCVIGAALPLGVVPDTHNDEGVSKLIISGIVEVEPTEYDALVLLQNKHDAACSRRAALPDFNEHLDKLKAELGL